MDANCQQAPDRRRVARKLLTLATLGITGLLLSQEKTGLLPGVGADTTNGSVAFYSGGKTTGDNSKFFWNDGDQALGIGTSSPAEVLHISNSGNNILLLQSTNGGAGNTANMDFLTYATGKTLIFPTVRLSVIDDGVFSGHLAFLTKNGGADSNPLTERMRITDNGLVGIGTTTPGASLDVEGVAGSYPPHAIVGNTTEVPPVSSDAAILGQGWNVGVQGVGGSPGEVGASGIGVLAVAGADEAIALVVQAYSGTNIANLQEWQSNSGAVTVVDHAGNLGVGTGTSALKTTLQVNGGVSAKISTQTGNYTMTTSDFAILANATSAALKITLPPASTGGMLVHVKKVDASTNVVTVAGAGTDKIEGAASKSLSKRYTSLTLIADGTSNWYILSNAT